MKPKEYQLHQGIKKWNMVLTLFFIIVGVFFYGTLLKLHKLPSSIGVFDFIILALATFRLIRLFVYDNILLFLREAFMDKRKSKVEGEELISFVGSHSALKRTIYKLLLCPWCIGVWAALCSIFVYYLLPASYVIFLILAVSSLASILQVISNSIGWHAEHTKVVTEKLTQEN